MKRLQRSRQKGYRTPEGAVYVGRPTIWGNPFRQDDPWVLWAGVALGHYGNRAGRTEAAANLYRAWLTDGFPAKATVERGGGSIEFSNGKTVTMGEWVQRFAAGVTSLYPAPAIPDKPALEPLRGHDLVCWCPVRCGAEVDIYGERIGLFDPCTKPAGHPGHHDPSLPAYCHADVLVELLSEPVP